MSKIGKYYATNFCDVGIVHLCLSEDGDFQTICSCYPTREKTSLENAQHIVRLLNEYEKANPKPYVNKNQLELELNGVTHND